MSTDPIAMSNGVEAAALETLVANLRNAHALERQAITVLEAQLKQMTDFPDLHERLTAHIVETRDQARRLEAGLELCGASKSMFKDALLSVMALGQTSVQGWGEDAVMKAVAADMMTEHLEIATYRVLILLADMAGKPELRQRLEETLREEEAMAAWFDDNLESITRRFIELKAAGKHQGNEAREDGVDTPDTPDTDKPHYAYQAIDNAKAADRDLTPNVPSGDLLTPTRNSSTPVPGTARPLGTHEPMASARPGSFAGINSDT